MMIMATSTTTIIMTMRTGITRMTTTTITAITGTTMNRRQLAASIACSRPSQ